MKRIYFLLRAILSVGLIVLLLFTVDIQAFKGKLYNSRLEYVFLAFALGIADRILMAYKWNILLRVRGIWISLKNITITYLSATFFGLFLPSTVGADTVRAYAVAREGYPTSDVVSSIIMERLLGTMALMVLVLGSVFVSLFVLEKEFASSVQSVFWIVFAGSIILTVIIWASLNDKLIRRYVTFIYPWDNPVFKKVFQDIEKLYDSYVTYRRNKGAIATFFLLSCAENIFPILWSYCIALAFKIPVPFSYFFILVPIVLILRRLPISIGGIGVHEGAFVYFLSSIGIKSAEALLLGIATNILGILILLPGGILYAFGGFRVQALTTRQKL